MATVLGEFELATKIEAGDKDAFEEWLARYSKPIRRIVSYTMRDFPLYSEDALQESFTRIWQSLTDGKFRGRAKPSTWACRVAQNCCLEILRKGRELKHGCFLSKCNVAYDPEADPRRFPDAHSYVETKEALGLVEDHFLGSRRQIYWAAARNRVMNGDGYRSYKPLNVAGTKPVKESSVRAGASRALSEARHILTAKAAGK